MLSKKIKKRATSLSLAALAFGSLIPSVAYGFNNVDVEKAADEVLQTAKSLSTNFGGNPDQIYTSLVKQHRTEFNHNPTVLSTDEFHARTEDVRYLAVSPTPDGPLTHLPRLTVDPDYRVNKQPLSVYKRARLADLHPGEAAVQCAEWAGTFFTAAGGNITIAQVALDPQSKIVERPFLNTVQDQLKKMLSREFNLENPQTREQTFLAYIANNQFFGTQSLALILGYDAIEDAHAQNEAFSTDILNYGKLLVCQETIETPNSGPIACHTIALGGGWFADSPDDHDDGKPVLFQCK
ncbi:MAG: hypothetical protein LBJ95_03945 [Oscillospiraceae bacterium]|nr:hypothetical protein [Oscillospiraceae bacterium]